MTFNKLMNAAGQVCIDEREAYLIMFTKGFSGYVCRKTRGRRMRAVRYSRNLPGLPDMWIERRGLAFALRYVIEHQEEAPELAGASGTELVEMLARLP